MDHRLVGAIEKALDWTGPDALGREFTRGALPERNLCARLLTPARLLDLVMRRSLAPHRLQILVDGEFLHPHYYLTTATARRGQTPMADMRRLGELLRSGCTLVVDELNTYDPTMEVACRALQWWSHELVQVNTYLTTGNAAGFRLHWDDHDVLIVQVAGEKSWEVRGPSRPAPMYRDAAPNLDPPGKVLWSGTLRAGEAMHIPRGCWHQATRQKRGSGYSLHVTFGLTKRTGVHWLTWLADHARTHELFRHDLNRWDTPSDQAALQRTLNQATARLIADNPWPDYLRIRAEQTLPARHIDTHGLFGPPAEAVCITEFPPYIQRTDNAVTVRAAGKEIVFAESAWPALRHLLSGRPAAIDKVTADTGVDAGFLTQVLFDEGICGELTRELATGYVGLLMPEDR
jgi:JmjC domain